MALIVLKLIALTGAGADFAIPQQPAPGAAPTTLECDQWEQAGGATAQNLHNLATCYFRGDGRPRDLVRSRALYRQAADLGFARAMCALGNMMIAGQGGPLEAQAGLALCRRAAEAGDSDAQTDLGGYLLTGTVVPKDAGEARRWLTLAAERRHPNAAFLLAQIHWNGDGTPKDNAAAARWWRVAHDAGRPDAAYFLAREAFVRAMAGGRDRIDTAAVDESLRWFEIAGERDPDPSHRADAAEKIALIRQVQEALRRRSR